MHKIDNGVLVETLAAARTLTAADPAITKLDPGGAHRDVTLEGSGTGPGYQGAWRQIVNAADAAENLVVKNGAGTTLATINQNEEGVFATDSASGAWVLIRIATIALS